MPQSRIPDISSSTREKILSPIAIASQGSCLNRLPGFQPVSIEKEQDAR
jgi:hypothetical protein